MLGVKNLSMMIFIIDKENIYGNLLFDQQPQW